MPLEQLLIVTFTRMATGELRERVRERLRGASRRRSRDAAGATADDDVVAGLLATGTADELRCAAGRHRGARSPSSTPPRSPPPTASARQVLGGLGVAGDVDPDATSSRTSTTSSRRSSTTSTSRGFRRHEAAATFARRGARRSRRPRSATRRAARAPRRGGRASAEMRHRLASVARNELDRRKRAVRPVHLRRPAHTAARDARRRPRGRSPRARLRARFDVVLVDEFQDTDPVQWDILRRAFAETGRTLVLIGDPKQAIYSFRGADVYAYLAAAREATTRAHARRQLAQRPGPDRRLRRAVRAARSSAHAGIRYRAVRASDEHQAPRLAGSPCDAPLRVRLVPREPDDGRPHSQGVRAAELARASSSPPTSAADIVRLLDTRRAIVDGRAPPRPPGRHRACSCAPTAAAASIRDALDEVGVPAVINGAGSVFETEIAGEWLRLLEALERPASSPAAHSRGADVLPRAGRAEQVATAERGRMGGGPRAPARLGPGAAHARRRGGAGRDHARPGAARAGCSRRSDGERRLTDLRHVGQLLHAEATIEQLGATALTAWLRRRIDEAARDTANEDRSPPAGVRRRGRAGPHDPPQQGPRVPDRLRAVPVGSGRAAERRAARVVLRRRAAGERQIDVSLEGGDYQRHRRAELEEEAGEELRLLYVALTRARHQAVVWWAGAWQSQEVAAGQAPVRRAARTGEHRPRGAAARATTRCGSGWSRWPPPRRGAISVEPRRSGDPVTWTPPADAVGALDAARLGRGVDLRVAAHVVLEHHRRRARQRSCPASRRSTCSRTSRPSREAPAVLGDAAGRPSLFAGRAGRGARSGRLVHRVLERTDFAAADLGSSSSRRPTSRESVRRAAACWSAGLAAAIETPLGPALGGLRLRDLARADRLDELQFELPLAGGDEPTRLGDARRGRRRAA